jgi:Na+-translocating ferredoxin:NAD+ oxidoreductase RnfD subunit
MQEAMNKPRILKQAVMLRTLYALVPVLMVAIYYFG